VIEVEVENFQSVEKVRFKIDGFTALVGRSNIGKSALVRAIQSALTGASGTDFVRHGSSCERRLKENKKCKCQTTVRLRTPRIELVWEKGDAVNRYTITRPGQAPVPYDKVDRGTPDFLQPDFAPVKIGDSSNLIQVSEQFSPIFLLNTSGSVVADVLSDVARLDAINEATRLVTKDRKEASSTRTVRERDVGELARDLTAYDGLDLCVADVQRIEAKHADILARQAEFHEVQRMARHMEVLIPSILAIHETLKPKLPNIETVTKTWERFDKNFEFERELAQRSEAVGELEAVEQVDLPSLDKILENLKWFQQVDQCLRRFVVFKQDFERARALSAAKDPDPEGARTALERLRVVAGLLTRYEALTTSITTLEVQAQTADQEAEAVLEELKELGMCPTCAQPVGTDQHLHLEVS